MRLGKACWDFLLLGIFILILASCINRLTLEVVTSEGIQIQIGVKSQPGLLGALRTPQAMYLRKKRIEWKSLLKPPRPLTPSLEPPIPLPCCFLSYVSQVTENT